MIEQSIFLVRLCQPLCLQSAADPKLASIRQSLADYSRLLTEADLEQLAAEHPGQSEAINWVIQNLKEIQTRNFEYEQELKNRRSFFSAENRQRREEWHNKRCS